jgi:hypothetical protein
LPTRRSSASTWGQHFFGVKGFHQVVVGAGAEPGDTVVDVGAGGQHEHGAVESAFTHALADGEAVAPGEHDVEDHEVEALFDAETEPLVSVVGDGDLVALGAEQVGDDHLYVGVVFDE